MARESLVVQAHFVFYASGNIISDSSRIDISGNSMTLVTVPIDIDPGGFTGSWLIDGPWLTGPQTALPAKGGHGDHGPWRPLEPTCQRIGQLAF